MSKRRYVKPGKIDLEYEGIDYIDFSPVVNGELEDKDLGKIENKVQKDPGKTSTNSKDKLYQVNKFKSNDQEGEVNLNGKEVWNYLDGYLNVFDDFDKESRESDLQLFDEDIKKTVDKSSNIKPVDIVKEFKIIPKPVKTISSKRSESDISEKYANQRERALPSSVDNPQSSLANRSNFSNRDSNSENSNQSSINFCPDLPDPRVNLPNNHYVNFLDGSTIPTHMVYSNFPAQNYPMYQSFQNQIMTHNNYDSSNNSNNNYNNNNNNNRSTYVQPQMYMLPQGSIINTGMQNSNAIGQYAVPMTSNLYISNNSNDSPSQIIYVINNQPQN